MEITIPKPEYKEVGALTAFFTNATCGEACWRAQEDVCRCFCGGRNHGCMKTGNGISPYRMARIDGHMYQLKGFGKWDDICRDARRINSESPGYMAETFSGTKREYKYSESDKGAPARIKNASPDQCNRWNELAKFKGLDRRGIFQANDCNYLALLWVKI